MSVGKSTSMARAILAVFGISTAIGLFFAAQMYVTGRAFGHGAGWWQCVYWGLGDWYEWALLWPLILWMARRVPLERGGWLRGLALHLLVGTVLATLHVALCSLAAG